MKIPFTTQTVDVELPNTQGQAKITVKNITAGFHAKWEITFPSYSRLLSYYRLPRKVRITCRKGLDMEEVCHLGLMFTDVRLQFNPVRTAKWVNIRRLSYGIPNKGIAENLRQSHSD
jgi:hypothetical protein